jgi:hypothetical protein
MLKCLDLCAAQLDITPPRIVHQTNTFCQHTVYEIAEKHQDHVTYAIERRFGTVTGQRTVVFCMPV